MRFIEPADALTLGWARWYSLLALCVGIVRISSWSATNVVIATSDVAIPSEAQVQSFLQEMSNEKAARVSRNSQGEIISLELWGERATDLSLVMASRVVSLGSLTVGGSQATNCTAVGASALRSFTNLATVKLLCAGNLKPGFFKEICQLQRLRKVQITQASPPVEEYACMAKLYQLEELGIAHCTNFGNAQLTVITNLTNLKSLELVANSVTPDGTNVLGTMRGLRVLRFFPTKK
jgi:hypothetical protein